LNIALTLNGLPIIRGGRQSNGKAEQTA
jgi:hypothetical protein